MRAAQAVGEPSHGGADTAASASVSAAPPIPAAASVYQQKEKETEDTREQNERPQTNKEKGRLSRGYTLPAGNLLRKRRSEQPEEEEPSATAVGDSQGRRGGASSNYECMGEDDQILTDERQRQWMEEDAKTVDGVLTDLLISFSHNGGWRGAGGFSSTMVGKRSQGKGEGVFLENGSGWACVFRFSLD
uniref:Uncharacterized protein n=1 Tax=Chromera velia CCMP2878 TaxID=1169474 RepID=A0A0G4HND3_9ALVE|eukprot:Cvel_7675.t1-p1 / transcript=Cvel_7675.t1 / gene=Cvel_7675 / organism=Chromera_velia_CCMP2878 / gene_product=hypothetical protein / transcript_product=hypothetical protein / location=Cvel_scaffold407:56589-57152(-) / protein_length=188 / sequence_SO=supercontig / SO=protein_coding / is_pseudo=false